MNADLIHRSLLIAHRSSIGLWALIVVLALNSSVLAGSPYKNKRGYGVSELDARQELERLCAAQTIKTLPLVTVSTAALSLSEATVHTGAGYYTVLLPLRAPQGDIRSLHWGAGSIEETLTFMRLLEGGKITALKVEAFDEEFRLGLEAQPVALDLHDCPAETVKDLLKPCQDCFIIEWVLGHLLE